VTEASGVAGSARSASLLADPKALRALAHPIRMSLLGLLRSEGPLTATRAAELLGESSASCSFHLRQLAKYGLAEEAGGGQRRERPWRATAMFTNVPTMPDNPEFTAAASLFWSTVADRYFDALMRWLEAWPDEPAQWHEAALVSDQLLYLTAAELAELGSKIHELVDRYLDRMSKPELRPAGSRLIDFIQLGFPLVDRPSGKLPQSPPQGGAVR